ncbi:unnamed protein product, partial [Urochloa humidicola]
MTGCRKMRNALGMVESGATGKIPSPLHGGADVKTCWSVLPTAQSRQQKNLTMHHLMMHSLARHSLRALMDRLLLLLFPRP